MRDTCYGHLHPASCLGYEFTNIGRQKDKICFTVKYYREQVFLSCKISLQPTRKGTKFFMLKNTLCRTSANKNNFIGNCRDMFVINFTTLGD